MCGIAAIVGQGWSPRQLEAMVASQQHRGPDASGLYLDPAGSAGLGHNRLAIIDLSPAGHQPMVSHDGRFWLAFNGEIYNYLELRAELGDYPYHSRSDSEVLLAAYQRWGSACLDRLVGMFALLIWDEHEQRLFAARDRLGVKPLYYSQLEQGLLLASEIKALHAAGLPRQPDAVAWASYLALGLHDHSARTFWQGAQALPPGHMLVWQAGRLQIAAWYDLAERAGAGLDERPLAQVEAEYRALLEDCVQLRFRADVPVGINLSGGLDSSTLLGLVHSVQGEHSQATAFTFTTGHQEYDELPWVQAMLERTQHRLVVCRLAAQDVPQLASALQAQQDEPFGGLPTLAYARLFERAQAEGVKVLLDGQGMDEQWAGYDYYQQALRGQPAGLVQGTSESPLRPGCLTPELRALAEPFAAPQPFADQLRNLQYRDARYTKLPRALRFNDRASMRASVELREPFLDHRLFELALRQPAERKIVGSCHKWLLRRIARRLAPRGVVEAPKRALQTPQREWLRGPLSGWAHERIEAALGAYGGIWLERRPLRQAWQDYQRGQGENSFFIWQWISLGLLAEREAAQHE